MFNKKNDQTTSFVIAKPDLKIPIVDQVKCILKIASNDDPLELTDITPYCVCNK